MFGAQFDQLLRDAGACDNKGGVLAFWIGPDFVYASALSWLHFESAAAAVAYAIAYHQALGGLGLPARAGLHEGAVALRENPVAAFQRAR